MAISAATPVITTVPTIAGLIPPPANCVMIGRFLVRKPPLITPAPLLATYTTMTASGTSATRSDPIIHAVARLLTVRRRGESARSRIEDAGSESGAVGGAGGDATLIAQPPSSAPFAA